jgi:hypothetical protein
MDRHRDYCFYPSDVSWSWGQVYKSMICHSNFELLSSASARGHGSDFEKAFLVGFGMREAAFTAPAIDVQD